MEKAALQGPCARYQIIPALPAEAPPEAPLEAPVGALHHCKATMHVGEHTCGRQLQGSSWLC